MVTSDDATSLREPEGISFRSTTVRNAPGNNEQPAMAEEIYPDLSESSDGVLSSALALLGEADRSLRGGVIAASQDDMVTADDSVQRVQSLLPELFCCRSLGDSFATVVLSIYHGIRNREGIPVDKKQVEELARAVRSLLREPFLSYNSALGVVAKLEACGLRTDPPALAKVGDVLLG